MNPHTTLTMSVLALLLSACHESPPCHSEEAARKAADGYRSCLMLDQHGDAGRGCGIRAFSTYCKAPTP